MMKPVLAAAAVIAVLCVATVAAADPSFGGHIEPNGVGPQLVPIGLNGEPESVGPQLVPIGFWGWLASLFG